MLSKIKSLIKNYQMIKSGKPIIVGVSGGPDSMVLLDILSKAFPNKLIAAHLNHQFRGIDAQEDAEFVKTECAKRGIFSVIEEYDVKAFMKKSGLGTQEAARKIRYDYYLRIAREWDAEYIALGHHMNDQAETIMMRILRGTGFQGLGGIPYVREIEGYKIIRPLLDVTKEEIQDYAKLNNIPFRIDKSNFSKKYFRNEIRLEVLPNLGKYNPNIVPQLHHLAKIVQDENAYMDRQVEEVLAKILIERKSNIYKLNNNQFKTLDIALQRRVIHLILNYLGLKNEISSIHIEQIIHLSQQVHPSKSMDLPRIRAYRNYSELILTNLPIEEQTNYEQSLSIPSEFVIPTIHKKIKVFSTTTFQTPSSHVAIFDLDEIIGCQLKVRTRKNGDRIQGKSGSKKIKDLFIDKKIPKQYREQYPIITCADNILWVPAIKRSIHAMISEKTKKFLCIKFEDYQ